MNKIKIVAVAVFAGVIAASFLGFRGSESQPTPQNVFTFDCEYTEQKPTGLTQTCADGGVYVYKIKWSSWSYQGAKGRGIYSRNMCDPDCALGKRLEAEVNVELTNLTKIKSKYYLTNLVVNPVNPDAMPAELNPAGWDVSEFAKMMDWNFG